MPSHAYRVTASYTRKYNGRTGPDIVYNIMLQLRLFLLNINFWTEVQSYGKLNYLLVYSFFMVGPSRYVNDILIRPSILLALFATISTC